MQFVIFSIDNVDNLHTLSKFLRHMDTMRAMGKLKGSFRPMVGSYKGVLEYAFGCRKEDFDAHVQGFGFIDNQESVLELTVTNNGRTAPRTLAKLVYSSGDVVSLGNFKEVTKGVAMGLDAWTYDPKVDVYFAAEGE